MILLSCSESPCQTCNNNSQWEVGSEEAGSAFVVITHQLRYTTSYRTRYRKVIMRIYLCSGICILV